MSRRRDILAYLYPRRPRRRLQPNLSNSRKRQGLPIRLLTRHTSEATTLRTVLMERRKDLDQRTLTTLVDTTASSMPMVWVPVQSMAMARTVEWLVANLTGFTHLKTPGICNSRSHNSLNRLLSKPSSKLPRTKCITGKNAGVAFSSETEDVGLF